MWAAACAGVMPLTVMVTSSELGAAWPVLAIVATALSLSLLVAFWNSHLFVGIGIDLALVALALTRPEWIEKIVG